MERSVLGTLGQPNYGAPSIDPRLLNRVNQFPGGMVPAQFLPQPPLPNNQANLVGSML
jgi:hypothetical protein